MKRLGVEVRDLSAPEGRLIERIRSEVVRLFGFHDLEHLHEWPYVGDYPRDPLREDDQRSRAHRQFYRKFPRLAEVYACLATLAGAELLEGRPFVIQAVPNFRVHFPQSRAVGEAHRDRWYGHQAGEVTCWVPLTDAFGTLTVWVEGAGDVEVDVFGAERVGLCPVPVRRGQMLVFDAVELLHANRLNREDLEPVIETDDYGMERIVEWVGRGRSRVSIDFRVMAAELLDTRTPAVSVNTATPFTLGGYWTWPVRDLIAALDLRWIPPPSLDRPRAPV